MSTETKTAEEKFNEMRDPIALPENFFDQDDIRREQEFKSQYAPPSTKTDIDFENPAPGDPPPEVNPGEEDEKDKDKDKEPPEDLDFDSSLESAEKRELAELNRKLGTNFTDLAELKAKLSSGQSKEEINEIQKAERLVEYFNDVLEYDDKTIVRQDRMIKAKAKGIDISTTDFKDQLEAEIEKMEDNEVLGYAADMLRSQVKIERDQNANKIKAHKDSQKLTEQERKDAFKGKIQKGINDIYKSGTYLGVAVDKEDLLDIYSKIVNNGHIEHLKENPEDAVKFEFFKRNEDLINKVLERPDFQAGIQKALKEMGMDTSGTGKTVTKDKTSDQEDSSFLQRFVQ